MIRSRRTNDFLREPARGVEVKEKRRKRVAGWTDEADEDVKRVSAWWEVEEGGRLHGWRNRKEVSENVKWEMDGAQGQFKYDSRKERGRRGGPASTTHWWESSFKWEPFCWRSVYIQNSDLNQVRPLKPTSTS